MSIDRLTDRERRILEVTIQNYIETAEPVGSQTIARRSGLGISPASVRSTLSELETRGFLYHAHTSGGRIPTDVGYRAYVNGLLHAAPSEVDQQALDSTLRGTTTAFEDILRRAAQVLGVLTQELGVAVAPALDQVILLRLDLVPVDSGRLLLVFNLQSGVVRTIFVEIPTAVAAESVEQVARILNERLAGLSLHEIRSSLAERLRDAGVGQGTELLNIFIAEGDGIFDLGSPDRVVLGSAQMLVDQPEFSSNERMRDLLQLTERHDLLRDALESRRKEGLSITIGSEHTDPRLTDFTLVTSSYRVGRLEGVIGVLGPTRMPYEKIIGLVDHTSRLVEGLMQ